MHEAQDLMTLNYIIAIYPFKPFQKESYLYVT